MDPTTHQPDIDSELARLQTELAEAQATLASVKNLKKEADGTVPVVKKDAQKRVTELKKALKKAKNPPAAPRRTARSRPGGQSSTFRVLRGQNQTVETPAAIQNDQVPQGTVETPAAIQDDQVPQGTVETPAAIQDDQVPQGTVETPAAIQDDQISQGRALDTLGSTLDLLTDNFVENVNPSQPVPQLDDEVRADGQVPISYIGRPLSPMSTVGTEQTPEALTEHMSGPASPMSTAAEEDLLHAEKTTDRCSEDDEEAPARMVIDKAGADVSMNASLTPAAKPAVEEAERAAGNYMAIDRPEPLSEPKMNVDQNAHQSDGDGPREECLKHDLRTGVPESLIQGPESKASENDTGVDVDMGESEKQDNEHADQRLGELDQVEAKGDNNVESQLSGAWSNGQERYDQPSRVKRHMSTPVSKAEMLSYSFRYEPIDWEDEAMPIPMRLTDESEEEYRLHVDSYCAAEDFEDALQQMVHLQTVFEIIDSAWEEGKLPVRMGSDKLSVLKGDMASMNRKVRELEARAEALKSKYDERLKAKADFALEDTLRAEVARLEAEILIPPPADYVLGLVAQLRVARGKLDEIVRINALTVNDIPAKKGGKKTKKGGKASGDAQENEAVPQLVLPSDSPPTVRNVYSRMDEEGQEKLREKGLRQLQNVMLAQTPGDRLKALDEIDVSIRRAAREVQEFLPEASYYSKDIALKIHHASSRNLVCRYHARVRGYKSFDNVATFKGIGHPKNMGTKERPATPEEGHMNCGCDIDDVLMEFFIWKTFVTSSSNTNIKTPFSMTDDDFIMPKFRRYWVRHWMESTGLTVDAIYGWEGGRPEGIPRLMVRSLYGLANKLKDKYKVTVSIKPEGDDAEEVFKEYLTN